ncbi:cytochrome P450 2C31-like isoform X2 [Ahaetulla prasina]|uniref:cytochrome P450 2C31-like isoform X2 n=1 Tax=Ahaetulla prasina TaxID=499056 RepID=UPI0026492148|nr:cytochrome P450 2C31-like isoform X2 [Ahaetulla prasina]
MMAMGTFLFVLLLALLSLFFFKQLWSQRHLPPGPLALPLIGTLWAYGFWLREDYFRKHVKEYGNIYSMWPGHYLIVVLFGFKTVKEGMMSFPEEFSYRPDDAFMTAVGNRRGQPFDPSCAVANAVSNVICALSFGHQFAPEDENFQKLIKALDVIVKFSGCFFHVMLFVFPRLMSYLPGPHKEASASVELITSFAKQEIEKHKESRSLHEPQDFIDYYLLQMEKSRKDPNSTYNEKNLVQCIFDFFGAGIDTTFGTLMWALLLLTNRPNTQEKIQKEIEDVFGFSGLISYQDRKKLPYTNAVIHEMQRLKSVLLVGFPRQSTKDVKLRGYHIPKGTIIIADLRSVLLDPEQWETPEEFNPNHFLDKDGKFLDREEFLSFGIGLRSCVGEQLARIEIFTFLTSLLRAFSFRLPEGVKELNEEPVAKVMIHPHPYKLCAIPLQS